MTHDETITRRGMLISMSRLAVVGGHASMNWPAQLERLHALNQQVDLTTYAGKFAVLCDLAMLCRDAPQSVAAAYRSFEESDIVEAGEEMRDSLQESTLRWRPAGSDRELAISLGGQLRALDAELRLDPFTWRARQTGEAYRVPLHNCFVVPLAPGKHANRPGPGNGFGRRGTPHFRFLPAQIGSHSEYQVELVPKPRIIVGRKHDRKQLGLAALFPGLMVEYVPGRTDWVADMAGAEEANDQMRAHVAAAFEQPYCAAVWPELSMPPARLQLLQAELERRALTLAADRGPAVVAAGSWHDGDDGDRRNRMRVLDRFGNELMHYDKSICYDVNGTREGIQTDLTVRVLVAQDALIAFAICADFSEREFDYCPYEALDLDLILVASLGNLSTMRGHEAKAGKLSARWGTQSLVSQQCDAQSDKAGFVFPATCKGGDCGVADATNVREIRFT